MAKVHSRALLPKPNPPVSIGDHLVAERIHAPVFGNWHWLFVDSNNHLGFYGGGFGITNSLSVGQPVDPVRITWLNSCACDGASV
jgi:hypothetical protein